MCNSTIQFRLSFVVALVALVGVCGICSTAYGDSINVVNAMTQGATGDGTTDDTAALQDAYDLAASTTGVLYIPNGNYRITSSLVFGSGTYGLPGIRVFSDFATIFADDEGMGQVLWVEPASYLTLEGLNLDANDKATYGAYFYKVSGTGNNISQIRATGAESHGFFFDMSQVGAFNGLVAKDNAGDGFYVQDSNGAILQNFQALDNGGNGITVVSDALSAGVHINGGSIERNGGHGIELIGLESPTVIRDVWIESNTGDGILVNDDVKDVIITANGIIGVGSDTNFAIHVEDGAVGIYVSGNFVQRSSGNTNYAEVVFDGADSTSAVAMMNFNRYSGAQRSTSGTLMVPAPEPATLGVLALGLIPLLIRRSKKAKA